MKSALNVFNEKRKTDPFRLEHMDTFSDLLYVAETQKALSFLAHSVTEIDKYRVETSYIVGKLFAFLIRGYAVPVADLEKTIWLSNNGRKKLV